ncbi:class I SAM-dependent DNA methyltransferase [Thiomicrospira microaerophila]|uniref:class I SAM-dependent DNA methyltransferase n=1 Tax=Thiomicrospira microaerophila TaxID=406020 RepID=UPI0005CAC59A|nr:DNA methyltransferase [Thiomicrospira microaerophila]
MNKDHSKIIDDLEKAVIELDKDNFIYDFLSAFGIPKATITGLKKNTNGRNIGFEHGDIGFKNKIYFRQCEKGTNLQGELEKLKTLDAVVKGKARLLVVTDFNEIAAYDLTAYELLAEIELSELHKQYAFFLPLAGYEKAVVYSDHPADVKASEKLGLLFDLILKQNHIEEDEEKRHALNVFLTRLLFCFYAEDTGIFKESQMSNAMANTTQPDGSDLDQFFTTLFKVLNTKPNDAYRKTLPSHLSDFQYVNGGLFANDSFIPKFGKKARRVILEAGSLDWKKINPDIFGSMFQSVVDPQKRGSLGQHYTSVPNIMKVIQPLFLDKLYEELEKTKGNVKKLEALIVRLERIRIFDPACGSGNFLIIAYKELRRFEMAVFKALNEASDQDVMFYSGIRLSQFYGIEIDDFAHEIALLSLWLTEHQMNVEFKEEFGYAEPALPLKDAGNVRQGNSLRLDWEEVCPKSDESGDLEIYICGNPPFIGDRFRTSEQKIEVKDVLSDLKSVGKIDYVACWFVKSSEYMDGTEINAALVSTNSLFQGVQVSSLWSYLLQKGIKINFAYQPFSWSNSAKDKAGVHVSITGFSYTESKNKHLFVGDSFKAVKNISPYLLEGGNSVVIARSDQITMQIPMIMGSYTNDGGYLIFTESEKNKILESEPKLNKWIKQIVGADEYLNGRKRFCLWLKEATPHDIEKSQELTRRVNAVREKRLSSSDAGSRRQAEYPHLFREQHNPKSFLFVPQVSSERRTYIPVDIFDENFIPIAPNMIIPNGGPFEFGIVSSMMHNDWMRVVAGRLESRYRYSNTLVYNTFPFPEMNEEQKQNIVKLAKEIILIRQDYELEGQTLADMYDPDKMPKDLLDTHQALDKAVEKLYRDKPFKDASERLAFLFARYEELVKAESKT